MQRTVLHTPIPFRTFVGFGIWNSMCNPPIDSAHGVAALLGLALIDNDAFRHAGYVFELDNQRSCTRKLVFLLFLLLR